MLFFVASRGHHAEIGGITPGSMPAISRTIDEEGVLFDNWLLVRDGRLREAETRALLTEAPLPVARPGHQPRRPARPDRRQREGHRRSSRRMIDQFGLDVVQAYMRHVQDNAEESVRRVIDALGDGAYRYETDSGAVIAGRASRVDRERRSAVIDFTGTSPQLHDELQRPDVGGHGRRAVRLPHPGRRRHPAQQRLPAPAATSCVPDGSMLAPVYPAAMVAGNVETSQASPARSTRALGVQAEGSGTMNNVTFGNDRAPVLRDRRLAAPGAGDGFDGARAVQTHMTNSRLTDPEVLEWRLPGAARRVRRTARQRRRRAGGAAATAPYAASGSSSR